MKPPFSTRSLNLVGFIGFAAVRIQGPDRVSFLQGLITQDVRRVTKDISLRAASLNPQGRVIATFWLHTKADELLLITDKNQASHLYTDLKRFIFRSKVQLDCIDLNQHHWQAFASTLPPAFKNLTEDDLALAMLKHGVVEITATTREQFTAQQLNLDLIDAISFDKGCYTGQEIVVRTAHRGQVKRRIQLLSHPKALTELALLSHLHHPDKIKSEPTSTEDAQSSQDSTDAIVVNAAISERDSLVLAVTSVTPASTYNWQTHSFNVTAMTAF